MATAESVGSTIEDFVIGQPGTPRHVDRGTKRSCIRKVAKQQLLNWLQSHWLCGPLNTFACERKVVKR